MGSSWNTAWKKYKIYDKGEQIARRCWKAWGSDYGDGGEAAAPRRFIACCVPSPSRHRLAAIYLESRMLLWFSVIGYNWLFVPFQQKGER